MTNKELFLSSCVVLDTETTSKDYAVAEIIETGYVRYVDGKWIVTEELYKPSIPIPAQVQAICYITDSMVEGKPSFKADPADFQSVMTGYNTGYAVGHNYFYDMKVLENHGVIMPPNSLCTWRMTKKLFSEVEEIEETNLPYLRFKLEIDIPLEMRCHRAGNDALMTGKLLEMYVDFMENMNMLNKDKPYGPQISEWLAKPIIYKTMTIGKHKGELLTDIPKSYWSWAMSKTDWFNEDAPNYDPDFAASVEAVLS